MNGFRTFDDALRYASFSERDCQREVFDAFRAGKHVILHAPTGWGKTFSVLAAQAEGHTIYSLPLRVLVDSLVEDTRKRTLKRCVAHHGARRDHDLLDKGEDPTCPVDVVFTTLDQSLSAFLGIPIGISIRQGNILPAVVEASHLIFDEFHLFDPARSWRTALYALTQSRQNGIILTATLSDEMVNFLEEELMRSEVGKKHGVAVIRGNRPFVNEKIVRRGKGLDDPATIDLGRRTIIIRNQIAWAKETASRLRERVEVPVYLLHSEMLPNDRRATEDAVRRAFAEGANMPAILVATQVVEAGIDITCDVMHTDWCPPASFIQRSGRCARYKGDRGLIYRHPTENAAPYTDQADSIAALDRYLGDEHDLMPEAEHEIVNLAADSDLKAIEHYRKTDGEQVVREVRVLRSYAKYGEMIRQINNLNVAIGEDSSKRYKFISMARSSFKGRLDVPGTKFVRFDSERKQYDDSLTEPWGADFALLDPEHVGYAPDYGLKIGEPGGEAHFEEDEAKTRAKYKYILEPYALHLQRLWEQKRVVRWMIEKLAQHPAIAGADKAEFLVDFVIWSHDLGKLNPQWQAVHGVPPEGVPPEHFPPEIRPHRQAPLGHSEDEGLYKRQKPPPSHAWMSAWAVSDLLCDIIHDFDELRRPVFWAIADHHGYVEKHRVERFEPYNLGYLDYLDEMSRREPWQKYGLDSGLLEAKVSRQDAVEAHQRMQGPDSLKPSDELGVYYMLSYILRRCDQLATSLTSETVQKSIEPPIQNVFL